MVPIAGLEADRIEPVVDGLHRSTAIRHAMIHGRPGLWGDDPGRPSSVAWLREGDDRTWEAFAWGNPDPVLGWLAARSEGREIALLAPRGWEAAVLDRGGRVDRGLILTFVRGDPPGRRLPSASNDIRRLTTEDGPAFEAAAPSWALKSWGDFATLISRGVAFGLSNASGLRDAGLDLRIGPRPRQGRRLDLDAVSGPRPRPDGGLDARRAHPLRSTEEPPVGDHARQCRLDRARPIPRVSPKCPTKSCSDGLPDPG